MRHTTSWLSTLRSRVELSPPLRKRLAQGSLWALMGALASQGSRLAAFIVAARLLGQEVFGELSMLHNTIGMAGVFAGLGIGLTATRHVAQYRRTDPDRAGRIVGLSSVVAVASGLLFYLLLRLFSAQICAGVLNAPHLGPDLDVAAWLVWLNTLLVVQTSILAGLEAFPSVAAASIVQGIVVVPAIVAGASIGGLHGALVGMVIAGAVGCAAAQTMVVRQLRKAGIRVSFSVSGQEGRVLIGFSLPTLLSGLVNLPVQWLAMTILTAQPNGYLELGVFSAANQWRLLIIFVPTILERSILPILTDLGSRGDIASYRRTIYSHLQLSAGTALLLALPLTAGAPFIMGLYGGAFRPDWIVLPLLAGAGVIASASVAVATVMVSRGSMWLGLLVNAIWAAAMLGSASLLAPTYGAVGLGLSYLIAYAVQSVGHLTYIVHIVRGFRRQRQALLPDREPDETTVTGIQAHRAASRTYPSCRYRRDVHL